MQLYQNEFYVYFIKLDEEVIYIGKGRKYRYLQSKRKFMNLYPNDNITYMVYKERLLEEEAYELEGELIRDNPTRHNKNKTTIGLCRDKSNIDNKSATRKEIIKQLLDFIKDNNKYPSRRAKTGSEEYKLSRKLEAYMTKTHSQYDEELKTNITEIREKYRAIRKQDKQQAIHDQIYIKNKKREQKRLKFITYVQKHRHLPDKRYKDEYNYMMFHYYPSSEAFDSELREIILKLL